MDTDGRQQVRLTQHPDADFQPVWVTDRRTDTLCIQSGWGT